MKILGLKRRRDIGRQKWQFLAVLAAVVLGVALFAGTFNAYLNLGSSLEGTYDRLNMADMTVTGADPGFVDTAAAVAGVETAIERRQADVPFQIDEYSFLGRIVGVPADEQPAINQLDIEEGSYLDPADPSGVLLQSHGAQDFELEVGDTFTVAGQEVTVAGIVISPEYLWPARDSQNILTPPKSFAVAYADESLLELAQNPAILDQVLVLYEDGADREELDAAVTEAAQAANAGQIQPLEEQPSNFTIQTEIDGLQTIALALPILFLAAAGLAIYVVITRLVFSQRGVIGTLRASGFTSRLMGRHYLLYGLSVGLVGAAVGVILGSLLGRGMTALYTQVFGIPDLVAEFHLPTVLFAFAFGAVAGSLAAWPPARTVSRMAPAEAMRGDTPAVGGKRSIFETLIPPLRRAPVRWKMSLRGIGRNKKRSTSMVLGVVLGMTLILASWGMIDTMLLALDRQFNEVAIEDANAVFSVSVGDEQVAAVAAVPGVEVAEPVLALASTVRHEGAEHSTVLEGYQLDTAVHGFDPPLPASGALLGQAMEDLLEVSMGDEVTIEFPTIGTEITTTVEGFVDEPLGTMAYMEADALTAAIGEANPEMSAEALAVPSITTVKAVYEDGADNDTVLAAIKDLPDVAAAIDSNELREIVEDFQAFFYVMVGMMVIFGGVMAFALIFNIISEIGRAHV